MTDGRVLPGVELEALATVGWNLRQREVDQLRAEIERLKDHPPHIYGRMVSEYTANKLMDAYAIAHEEAIKATSDNRHLAHHNVRVARDQLVKALMTGFVPRSLRAIPED